MRTAPARLSVAWQRGDCLALAVLVGAWGAGLAWQWHGWPVELGQPPRVDAAKVAAVREQIDPNTATVESLRRLPGIGPEKAAAIVAYRRGVQAPGAGAAYRSVEDLQRVPGIGPKTVQDIARYLRLPTQPAAGRQP